MSSAGSRSKGRSSSLMAGSSHSVLSRAREGWAFSITIASAGGRSAFVRSGPPPAGLETEGRRACAW
ncbi:hypothetical protein [Streptomyces sp. NPDC051572]|uniref:hypothetical protein n=1 Tax=unclassified Streptomyces TaxID=2593676 RepID=UPI00344E0BFC